MDAATRYKLIALPTLLPPLTLFKLLILLGQLRTKKDYCVYIMWLYCFMVFWPKFGMDGWWSARNTHMYLFAKKLRCQQEQSSQKVCIWRQLGQESWRSSFSTFYFMKYSMWTFVISFLSETTAYHLNTLIYWPIYSLDVISEMSKNYQRNQ